jgi:hypothetical protein
LRGIRTYQIIGGFVIDAALTEEEITKVEGNNLGTELKTAWEN